MARKTRNDKKDTTCERCGKKCSTPQKLREHLNRKFPCKPHETIQTIVQESNQAPVQVVTKVYTSVLKEDQKEVPASSSSKQINKEKTNALPNIQGSQRESLQDSTSYPLGKLRDNENFEHLEETKDIPFNNAKIEWNYQNLKRKLGKFENLRQECCNPEEFDRMKFYLEMEKESKKPYTGMITSQWALVLNEAIQYLLRDFKDKKEIIAKIRNELRIINEDPEKELEFREQDELGLALKRRATAVYRAKVPKFHPDNGSDIRKMLESQRKKFKEMLEKEFDKRGQFKFSLCSLGKFLLDEKPGNETKGNSRMMLLNK
ncbi:hypothetical protein C1646_765053 [Rhizophagus diaphanus]|nr:hypothetical protein C1646_765053 [Rhizophagus diaphanus] [Rhizophagus sp. MUCL 43196]